VGSGGECIATDKESCRPDFAVALYPGHLWVEDKKFELNPDIRTHITRQTPPTFLLQAENDNVDNVNQSLVYYIALKNAGVPVEMHLYAQGGHAFGLRRTNLPITGWPELVETWLRTIGMIPEWVLWDRTGDCGSVPLRRLLLCILLPSWQRPIMEVALPDIEG
jgi:acetyl esterase/lipase